jgi:hypothetical protein
MNVHDSAVDRNDYEYEAVLRIRIRELGSGIRCLFESWIQEKKDKKDVSKYVRKFLTIFSKSWLCIKISKKLKYLSSLMWIRIWDPQHCYEVKDPYCSTVQ